MYGPENNKNIKNNCVIENGSLFKSKVHKNYYDCIIKGTIWSFMLLISLVGLILVFRDNYNDKDVIFISSKNNSYMKDKSMSLNNFEDSISEENKNFLKKYAKDEDSKIIKKEVVKNTPIENKNIVENNNTDLSNDNIQNHSTNEVKNSQNTYQESNNTLSNLIQEVTNNKSSTTEIEKTIIAPASKPSISTNTNLNKIWLVTIYSSPDLSKAQSMWIKIQNKHLRLFGNKKVYFIKTNIPSKGTYYRVSLGDKQVNNIKPSFKTSKEASNYCKYLKDNNVSCFITEVEESNLDKLINE